MTIVITTPTGQIGHQILQRLLSADAALRVVARDPARLPAEVRDRAEVARGSHGDRSVVEQAFAGADAVFWCAPPNAQAASLRAVYADFARPACEALARLGVQRVVGITALGRGFPGPAGHVTASLEMDDLLAASGVAYRGIAMPSFTDNLLRQREPITRQGMLFGTLAGDRRLPMCATRDAAATAAALLLDPSWRGHETVPQLGPEDISFDEVAAILSDLLGRPVRYRQITLDALRAQLVGAGASHAIADGMVAMMRAKDEGLDNLEPRTAAATTPTSVRRWCSEVFLPALAT